MLPAYLTYLALSAGIMAAIIAVTFMLGRITNNRGLEGKARVWMGDFVENIIVLLLILAVYSSAHVVSNAVLESMGVKQYLPDWVPQDDALESTIKMLERMVEELLHLTVLSGEVYHTIELMKNLQENWGFPGVDILLNFYAAADYYEGPTRWATTLGAMVFMSANAQMIALTFIEKVAYPAIMMALVFRFLNIFRGAANVVIAIALAYSAIFPFLYVTLVALLEHYTALQFGVSPFEMASVPSCFAFLENMITRIFVLFFPVVPYMGPCILDIFAAIAVGGAAVIVIPTFLISITNAFVDALAYMLNLEYRAGQI